VDELRFNGLVDRPGFDRGIVVFGAPGGQFFAGHTEFLARQPNFPQSNRRPRLL
jgi:hypothetical protein